MPGYGNGALHAADLGIPKVLRGGGKIPLQNMFGNHMCGNSNQDHSVGLVHDGLKTRSIEKHTNPVCCQRKWELPQCVDNDERDAEHDSVLGRAVRLGSLVPARSLTMPLFLAEPIQDDDVSRSRIGARVHSYGQIL